MRVFPCVRSQKEPNGFLISCFHALVAERISFDAYAGKAGVLILAFFDLSCFLILYLDCFHMVMLIGVLMR